MGFEPVTSVILVRCSTNWAMKPYIGSEVNLLSLFSHEEWNDVKYIWNNSYIWTAVVDQSEEWSSQLIFQFKQLERRSLKKNQGFNGIQTRDLRDTGAMLYQLSYEAIHWERGQFIEFILPWGVKWCEVYMK